MSAAFDLAEQGLIPDWGIRWGIRRLLTKRLHDEQAKNGSSPRQALQDFVSQLRTSPIALHAEKANEQHYELPPKFFEQVLGKWLKYSSCYWPASVTGLDAAEEAMLRLTCERAQLQDGMHVLELGCGGLGVRVDCGALSTQPSPGGVEFQSATRIYSGRMC